MVGMVLAVPIGTIILIAVSWWVVMRMYKLIHKKIDELSHHMKILEYALQDFARDHLCSSKS